MKNLKNSLAGGVLLGALLSSAVVADTIKVGVLHSLSGTMAISETTLKDTMLMLIEEQNAKGGVLGKHWRQWLLILPLIGLCSRKSTGIADCA